MIWVASSDWRPETATDLCVLRTGLAMIADLQERDRPDRPRTWRRRSKAAYTAPGVIGIFLGLLQSFSVHDSEGNCALWSLFRPNF